MQARARIWCGLPSASLHTAVKRCSLLVISNPADYSVHAGNMPKKRAKQENEKYKVIAAEPAVTSENTHDRVSSRGKDITDILDE